LGQERERPGRRPSYGRDAARSGGLEISAEGEAVKLRSHTLIARVGRRGSRVGYPLFFLTAAAAAVAVYAISAAVGAPATTKHLGAAREPQARQAAAVGTAPPGPAEFARDVVGATNAFAKANGDPTRITNVDCVEASAGHYMCSYAFVRANGPRECHLMQAIWTPSRASTFTVTLAGRVHRCETLRQALDSLP
jgi:hypothetical protein